jgi:hypothetical protein
MRVRSEAGQLTVHAIAGTYVVLLGIDIAPGLLKGLLGFAVRRTDHLAGEQHYLQNFRSFKANAQARGLAASSLENPFQAFLWGDYSASPERIYTYEVSAMYGRPGRLRRGPSASVHVMSEREDTGTHAIFFNRGAAGSQAYANRFQNRSPSNVPFREAYKWLSRGLEEALLAFIGQAHERGTALRAAVYEFQHERVLRALRIAIDAGADVKIVYDAKPRSKDTTDRKNLAAIRKAGLADHVLPRTNTQIAHNKFIVFLRDGRPEQVWTGSTNITEGALFGHWNVGHLVRDRRIAAAYLDYWHELSGDPPRRQLREFCDGAVNPPSGRPRPRRTAAFSPRSKMDALRWYVRMAEGASSSLFLTAAFGLGAQMESIFAGRRDFLRYLLLDTERGNIQAVRRDPGNMVVAGGRIGEAGWRQWVQESLTGLNGHVQYIHTKYMLIDPLSDDPVVITGSANWSENSSTKNDENMLVIRGDTRVADVYLGEFMRLFNHFEMRGQRSRVAGRRPFRAEDARAPAARGPKGRYHLYEDERWALPFFADASPPSRERLLFRGEPAAD